MRAVRVGLESGARRAVVAESVERRGRHGVDRIGADQLINVENVLVSGILGSGAGPQQPLRLRAVRGQGAPAVLSKDSVVALVRHLGVGDGDLAHEAVGFIASQGLKLSIDDRVDAADEEARDACHVADITPGGGPFLESGDVGARDLFVHVAGKQQGDVDVDALADQLLDGRQSRGRARHLDHHVGARHGLPETASFGDRPLGVVRQEG